MQATQVLFVSMQNFVTVSSGLGGCGSKKLEIPSKYIRYIFNQNWKNVLPAQHEKCFVFPCFNKITYSEERESDELLWYGCDATPSGPIGWAVSAGHQTAFSWPAFSKEDPFLWFLASRDFSLYQALVAVLTLGLHNSYLYTLLSLTGTYFPVNFE